MSTLQYTIIDVFSSTAYKGNPLAVVNNLNTSNTLTKPQMQLIARQFNLSETTFICPPTTPTANLRLRSFLPNGEEVFGAGHNSLGAWWWAVHSGTCDVPENGDATTYHQQLGDAVLPVEVSKSDAGEISISMRHGEPRFLNIHADKASLAEALGIDGVDIGLERPSGSTVLGDAQVVTTSPARHLLIPLRSKEVLDRVSFTNKERIAQELASTESHNSGVYVFTAVEGKNGVPRFEARFFSPGMGMEDPATGSAAGPLAAYLWNHAKDLVSAQGDESKAVDIEVVQGLKTGRECLLKVTVGGRGPGSIELSGTGVLVADGNIAIPSSDIVF
jgi:PhzF family phenazine biosynthesis protein